MENTIRPNNPITYSLNISNTEPDFYSELEEFKNHLINKAKIEYFGVVSAYQNYVEENKIEKPRKWEEYFLELLMLGVFWNIYSPYISNKTRYFRFLFSGLYKIRSKNAALKPYVDKLRGYLATSLLSKNHNQAQTFNPKNIKLLLNWMDCTKEFTEEVKRLNNWVLFFMLNPVIFNHIQNTISQFANGFKTESKEKFGGFTSKVNKFLKETHPENKYKENYFFTGRREEEYHLNMVGAAILNRILQEEFQKTNSKVVMLPTCMRFGKPCKAKKTGFEMLCTHCDQTCNVSRITKDLSGKGIRTVLIPHSSKFSEYLKLWACQKETGLVGIACVLNLMRGGYELIGLNIPSQCVFLDHCGCKKHWSREGGVPTHLNMNQLKKILQFENEKKEISVP